MRVLAAGNIDAAERLDRLIRRYLKTLRRATMEVWSGVTELTPAEWATDLIERLAEAERTGRL